MRWILKDLLNHSRQWAEVLIWTEAVGFNQNLRLLPNEKGHLPLLKKLEIKSSPYFVPAVHPSFASIFKDAPLLTHVGLRDISEWGTLTGRR